MAKAKGGESAVQDSIRGYLEARGWLVIRFQSGLFVGWFQLEKLKSTIFAILKANRNPVAMLAAFGKIVPTSVGSSTLGRKSFPDLIALKRWGTNGEENGPVDCLLIECKAPGKKPNPEQTQALDALRRVFRLRALYADGLEDGNMPFADYYRRKVDPAA